MILERAVDSDIPFGWFTGDEVYGSDRNLRLWLELGTMIGQGEPR